MTHFCGNNAVATKALFPVSGPKPQGPFRVGPDLCFSNPRNRSKVRREPTRAQTREQAQVPLPKAGRGNNRSLPALPREPPRERAHIRPNQGSGPGTNPTQGKPPPRAWNNQPTTRRPGDQPTNHPPALDQPTTNKPPSAWTKEPKTTPAGWTNQQQPPAGTTTTTAGWTTSPAGWRTTTITTPPAEQQ